MFILNRLNVKLTTLKYSLIVLLSIVCANSEAQNTDRIEGFKKILRRDISDSLYIKLNIDIADEYIFNNPDSSEVYTRNALQRAVQVHDSLMMAKAENFLGIINYSKGYLLTALEHYQTSQNISKKIGDSSGAVKASNNIAIVYTNLGEYDKAIGIYEEAFQTNMELNLVDAAASNIFNIASSYLSLKDYARVRESVKKLTEFNAISSTSIDPCFIMADVYIADNKLDSAMQCLRKGYDISIEQGDEFFLVSVILSMAQVSLKLKEYDHANRYLSEAAQIIDKNDFNDMKLDMLKIRAELASSRGAFEQAYKYNLEFQALKDSLNSINNFNRISELNAKYESEKKEAEIARQSQLLDQKNSLFRISVIVAVALMSLLGVIVYNLSRKKKMNRLLKDQNNEIKRQRHKVISSINYARRIQRSILPMEEYLKKFLPQSFVYFKPRDIVSGDFYWYRWVDDRLYIAAIDCTGHGVPGAFMSLIANSKINKTINELKQREPHDILYALHYEIKSILNQERDPQNAQDGMDISLCVIDFQMKKIKYGGANLGIYISKGNDLVEYRPNPISLGGMLFEKQMVQESNPFVTHEISYTSGDYLFMYSDGMMDQLGKDSKKLNKTKFRNLLESIRREDNMDAAATICNNVLEDWKGGEPQTDDILIIAAKMP